MQVSDLRRDVTFEYQTISLDSVAIEQRLEQSGKRVIEKITVGDEEFPDSGRFMVSLMARFGFNAAFFKYFTTAEVLERIQQVESNDRVRVCIARYASGPARLLAASNPTKGAADGSIVMDLMEKYGSEGIVYNDGVITSTHAPFVTPTFEIAGDEFTNKFTMSVPVDGYGNPFVTLAVNHKATNSNIVPKSKVFRSDVKLGKGGDDLATTLGRALESFNHDEGYAAFRDRLESAANSWCSIHEAYRLHTVLHKAISYGFTKYEPLQGASAGRSVISANLPMSAHMNMDETAPTQRGNFLIQAFHKMTGNIQEQYGFANLDALTEKRRRGLPVKCSVFNLLLFAGEVASHHLVNGHDAMHELNGALLGTEYDMEGSMSRYKEFDQFWSARNLGKATQDAVGDVKN